MSRERTKLIERLDLAHSLVVRKSVMSKRYETVACYTCDSSAFWQQMTCGHLWGRKCKLIRWDFDNCRPQCRECQGIDNGRRVIFEARLRIEIGNDRVDALARRRDQIKMWTIDELRELLAERKEQLRNL